ncbi:MAG: TonB-dependent receptor [Acidobacteriota bacterium]
MNGTWTDFSQDTSGGADCPRISWALIAWLLTVWPVGAFAQAPPSAPPDQPTFQIEVIAATPLPGLDLRLEEIPAPVQTAIARDIEESGALDLSDFLNRRITSVHINETQGNPFQADVSYRGYAASPLLGTPQGLSVYMDGVRLNQPFGDVVSWDLIPRIAIASAVLMPGSNPLFGLNTLGGALSIQTKDGRANAGTHVRAVYGSNVRRAVEFEHGGRNASGLNWYMAGNLFAEDGWRVASPSDVRQWFSKIGWERGKNDIGLTFAYANNSLTGNGLQDPRLLAADYASVYTIPDRTNNRSTLLNLTAKHAASRTLTLTGNLYFRDIRADTTNGDLNEDSLDQSVYQPSAADIRALTGAGLVGFPASGANAGNTPFPSWRCIAQALQKDEPAEKCNGLVTTTETRQQNAGFSGQATWTTAPRGQRNQLTAGAGFDSSRVDFAQVSQLGYLNPDRSVATVNAFADGTTNVDGAPFDTRVSLHGAPSTWSLYATDTLSLGNAWHATVSGRFNRTTIDNSDRLTPGGGPGSLDGRYAFGRLNPAVGLTFTPTRTLNVYAGYSEGSRAPTSIELGCANPAEPCKLPNAMAGDPPLDQVVVSTWEAGLRGGIGQAFNWNIGAFRATNHSDILFVASTATGFGYFRNFGETRRQGVELGVSGRVGRVSAGAGYTYLDATYQTAETVDGSSNSSNDAAATGVRGFDGTIQVRPGNRIPLIPAHLVKAFADLRVTTRASVGLNLVGVSSSYARGNENNQDQPDGTYYIGAGSAPGYAVANLGVRYQVARDVHLVAQVNNVFDTRYYTAAQLGATGLTSTGAFIARPFPAVGGEFPVQHASFLAPGAPRAGWMGLRIGF